LRTVTTVPGDTVRVAGLNMKFLITIVSAVALPVAAAEAAGLAAPELLPPELLPLQAVSTRTQVRPSHAACRLRTLLVIIA
jgi:hypothetical protein